MNKFENSVVKFLQSAIDEMDGYIKDKNNGYDDLERHDCSVAREAYEHVLNYITQMQMINERTEYAVEVRNPDRFIAQLDVFSNIQEAQKFVENYTAPLCDGEFLNIVFINYDKNGNEISSGTVC